MKLIRLDPGKSAPETADHVHILLFKDGRCGWTGSVVIDREVVYGIGKNEIRTFEQTEAEAIAWAAHHGASELLIEADLEPREGFCADEPG